MFTVNNVRAISQVDLVEALEDTLFALREQLGSESYRGSAQGYLNERADNEKRWLLMFCQTGIDEPYFDLTPATKYSSVICAERDNKTKARIARIKPGSKEYRGPNLSLIRPVDNLATTMATADSVKKRPAPAMLTLAAYNIRKVTVADMEIDAKSEIVKIGIAVF